jgi:hypothetical protein
MISPGGGGEGEGGEGDGGEWAEEGGAEERPSGGGIDSGDRQQMVEWWC